MLVTFGVNPHQIDLCVVAAVGHALFVVGMDALLVKQVVSTAWASPPLALCYPIALRVRNVVGLAVFRPACHPIGVQGWVVGRGGASHLDVTGDFGGGESE